MCRKLYCNWVFYVYLLYYKPSAAMKNVQVLLLFPQYCFMSSYGFSPPPPTKSQNLLAPIHGLVYNIVRLRMFKLLNVY